MQGQLGNWLQVGLIGMIVEVLSLITSKGHQLPKNIEDGLQRQFRRTYLRGGFPGSGI